MQLEALAEVQVKFAVVPDATVKGPLDPLALKSTDKSPLVVESEQDSLVDGSLLESPQWFESAQALV